MGSKWRKGCFSDIAIITMGQSPKGTDCNNLENGIPLLNGPTEFSDWHPYPIQFTTDPKKYAEEGDLLFCVRGSTTGRMNWAEQKYAIGRGIASFRHRLGKEYHAYLRALVEYKLPILLQSATGSTFPNVSRTQLLELEIDVPFGEAALAISRIIDSLDKKIYLNQQTNQTLEQMAQTLFKSWFVDFDPVFDNILCNANYQLENLPADFPDELRPKAKQRLTAPQNNPEKTSIEREKNGNKAFPSEFEFNEQLGWIPKGWEDGSFEKVADALSGYAFKGKDFSVDGYAVIKIKNISTDRTVSIFDVNRIPPEIGISASRFLLSDGDIIMAMTGAGSVGRFGVIASESNEPYYLNQRVCKLSPKLKNGIPFLFAALNKTGVEEGIFKGAQGSGQPNISANGILATKLLVPNVKSIELFNTLLMEAFNQKITLRKESYTLTKLRDTLLPKLISGELQVSSLRTSGEKTA
ncbi:MAG: hypothetical protein OFPII_28540 [Osedax symbiont Rs1]|nr:MAG: hypothetical protein OFPII_28540 [Osedax symbiont Rs1]